MTQLFFIIPLACALLASAAGAQVDSGARAIVEKAIKALGGPQQVARLRKMRVSAEGTMTLLPGKPAVNFTIHDVWDMPRKYKSTLVTELDGRKIRQTLCLDGKAGWIRLNGVTRDHPRESLEEMREQKYAEDLDRLGFLNIRGLKLSRAGESKVLGRPASVVLVQVPGHRDVRLHFDQKSGLLVQRSHPVEDPATRGIITQDVVFSDYRDFEGLKHYGRVRVDRAGARLLDARIVRVLPLTLVDSRVFERPAK